MTERDELRERDAEILRLRGALNTIAATAKKPWPADERLAYMHNLATATLGHETSR